MGTNYTAAGGAGVDTTALHDDTAAEISAVTLKGSPVAADELLIEDSADSYSKKSVTLSTLPAPVSVSIADNSTSAYEIVEGSNDYLKIWTFNAAEFIYFGNAVTNPGFVFLGSGTISHQDIARTAQGTIPGGNGSGNVGDLATTPVEVIAAPGAGSYIHVLEAHLWLDYGTAAYDTGSALTLRFTNGAGAQVIDASAIGWIQGSADDHLVLSNVSAGVYTPVDNAAIVMDGSSDPYGAAGDSPLKYEILYFVRNFTW